MTSEGEVKRLRKEIERLAETMRATKARAGFKVEARGWCEGCDDHEACGQGACFRMGGPAVPEQLPPGETEFVVASVASREVRCGECGARPGDSCVGNRGEVRRTAHPVRWLRAVNQGYVSEGEVPVPGWARGWVEEE